MYRYHKDLLNVTAMDDSSSAEASDLQDPEIEEDSNCLLPDSNQCNYNPTVNGAKFILKTRDGKRLTQTTTDGIIEDSKILVQSTVDLLENKVIEVIKSSTATEDTLTKVKEIFADAALRTGLDSLYKQEKFIQEQFNYVVSLCLVCFNAMMVLHAATSGEKIGKRTASQI